jgi:prepilin peptidase dependent protein B
MPMKTRGAARRSAQAGLSLVELLIGVAISLVIVAGGLGLLAGFTAENRRLLLETRMNQDLRAAMDVVTRDLRRAGYWQGSAAGASADGAPAVPAPNPYRSFYSSACNAPTLGASAPSPTAPAAHVCYAVARDGNSAVNEATRSELYGFHLNGGVLYAVLNGGAQQPLTDPGTITITRFDVTPNSQVVSMAGYCRVTCTANCPRVIVREFEITLQGTAPSDPLMQRQLRSSVRVRNDYHDGQCPAS